MLTEKETNTFQEKKTNVGIVSKLPRHYSVVSAKKILAGRQYAEILSELKTLAHVPESVFEQIYTTAIEQYAAFVQALPATQIESFNCHGGLLELGVQRALQSLAHYRKEHPVRQLNPENVTKRQAIWSYAVFTAGLLYGIGQIVATYWVMLCELNGQPKRKWNPFSGSMEGQAPCYRYSFETTRRDDLAARSTLALAMQLLPQESIAWIATDRDIFDAWMAILLNDERHSGLVATFILPIHVYLSQEAHQGALDLLIGDRIDAHDIDDLHEAELSDLLSTETGPTQSLTPGGLFVPNKQNALNALLQADLLSDEKLAQFFIHWLRRFAYQQKQEQGTLSVAKLMPTNQEGLLINGNLLKVFIDKNQLKISQHILVQRLLASGFTLGEGLQRSTTGLMGSGRQLALYLDPSLLSKIIFGGVICDPHSQLSNSSPYATLQSDAKELLSSVSSMFTDK